MNNSADITLQDAFCAAFCPKAACYVRVLRVPVNQSGTLGFRDRFYYYTQDVLRTSLIWFEFSIMSLCGAAGAPVSSYSPKT